MLGLGWIDCRIRTEFARVLGNEAYAAFWDTYMDAYLRDADFQSLQACGFLVNHSAGDIAVTLRFRAPVERVRKLAARGSGDLPRVQGAWPVNVAAWDGVVLAWEEERSTR